MIATSREAWARLQTALALRHREVMAALFIVKHDPTMRGITGRELDAMLPSTDGHKRLSELEDLGLARVLVVRPCSFTGRNAKAWTANLEDDDT